MHCFKCKTTLTEKKFTHPFLDEPLCVTCWELKTSKNHIILNARHDKLVGSLVEGSVKDDIHLGFVLCSVGSNLNSDGFDEEGLSNDYNTAQHQRIDWEHTNETIGVIRDSEFVASSNVKRIEELGLSMTRSFVYTQGILWKLYNISRAKQIVKRYKEGSLFYSMEDFFDYTICSTCGEKFIDDDDYCPHLINRRNTASETYRILRGNKFVGAGVVEKPADRDAVGLVVASNRPSLSLIAKLINPDLFDYYKFATKRS